jgi:hypothetical protein
MIANGMAFRSIPQWRDRSRERLVAQVTSAVVPVEPTVGAKPGEKFRLALRPQRLNFFDTASSGDLKNNVGTVSPLRRHRSPLLGRRHSSRATGVVD